jgi:hypothetical protein
MNKTFSISEKILYGSMSAMPVCFNRKRQRRGHLFHGRSKSTLVDADEYLKQLSRYIHLNPMRVKMVEKLSSYPWSSYPVFIGKKKAPNRSGSDHVKFVKFKDKLCI